MSFPPWTWDIPSHFNIGVACTDAHAAGPRADRTAVVVETLGVGVARRTFAELATETGAVSQALRELGLAPGDRVLLRLPNCIEYPLLFFGALKAGMVPVPTSVLLTADEVEYLARDSGAAAVVTDVASWTAMGPSLRGLPALRAAVLVGDGDVPSMTGPLAVRSLAAAMAAAGPAAPPHPTAADDPAYLVYTSGTTGYPKGVLHAHRALLGRQPSSEYWFDFVDGERVLHAGRFNWTYVLGTGLMDPLYRGHTAIVAEGVGASEDWPALIAKHHATTFIGVPTLYRQVVQKTATTHADVPTLRHCMSAGEPLSAEVLGAWRDRFGLDVHEALGMTECSYYICQTASKPIRPGAAGFIQPGHDVALLDPETLAEVGTDEVGMLCIPATDPALMLRYWEQPEETAHCFREGWFLTGDRARRDADGYVWFLGRDDDLINTFGYRVAPHEVERVLKEDSDVLDAAVVGEDVGPEKTVVSAYVIATPEAAIDPSAVLERVRQRLAPYKAPRVVYVVEEFPRTRNGKVMRRALTPAAALARAE